MDIYVLGMGKSTGGFRKLKESYQGFLWKENNEMGLVPNSETDDLYLLDGNLYSQDWSMKTQDTKHYTTQSPNHKMTKENSSSY